MEIQNSEVRIKICAMLRREKVLICSRERDSPCAYYYTHPRARARFKRSLASYMMHDVFFTIIIKFRRHSIHQTYRIFYSSLRPPIHPIPKKNLVVTAYSTGNYLVFDIIALQGVIFDEIISKQALNTEQVIQMNVWTLRLKSGGWQRLQRRKK